MKKYIPNTITSFNIASGTISIILSFEGFPMLAGIFIFIAAVFDFFDGFMARLLKAYSELGKQLDSLADLVSFGLAPGFIVYNLLRSCLLLPEKIEPENMDFTKLAILSISLLIPIASAFRLAKFNIDTKQTNSFLGLPTPANAIFFASLPIILGLKLNLLTYGIILNLKFLIPAVIIFSFLLVSRIPMFSLKFKNYKFSNNLIRYSFLFISLLFIILLNIKALPFIIIFYILFSLVTSIFNKNKHGKL